MEKKTAAAASDKQPPPEMSLVIPPDEERCCRNDGVRWRCTESRMNLGVSKDDDDDSIDTKYCEESTEDHYNFFTEQQPKKNLQQPENNKQQKKKKHKKKKKSSSEDGDDSSSGTETWDSTFLDWKKVKYHRKGIRPPPSTTHDTTSDIEGGSAAKRKKVEKTELSGELEFPDSLIEKPSNKEMEKKELPPDEQRCCAKANHGRYRCKNFRMGHGAADDDSVPKFKHCEKHYNYYKTYFNNLKKKKKNKKKKRSGDGEGAADPIGMKKKTVERTEASGEPESSTKAGEPMVEFGGVENYKSKCFELSMELQKKKAECIKLQAELEEVKARKDAAKDGTEWAEDAPEYWRKMFFSLDNRILRIENENSTISSVESRLSNLESLVLRNGNGNSKLRFVDLRNSEDKESEMQIESKYISKPNAETSKEGNKDSHVSQLKTEENVLKNVYDIGTDEHHESESEFPQHTSVNIASRSRKSSTGAENVKEGKDWSCGEETPSQAHLEMSNKPFVNLVSDDSGEPLGEDSDSSDSEDSLADLMDMIAMKCRNDREIKWKFEADMLSSFEEDPELCLKAICALHRQQTSEDAKGLFHYSDALRGTNLAKFLMDGACTGDLKKSVKELEALDSKAVEDCKRLARSYSKQLFSIYQNKKDPYFLPTTTASQ